MVIVHKPALMTLLAASLMACGGSGGNQQNPKQRNLSATAIADSVSTGVCVVGKAAAGNSGAPIIILEESHDSRAGQIQLAIALVRLHGRYRLRDIALEGYLLDAANQRSNWFAQAARGDTSARQRVAVNLLAEGEISCAEFLNLCYDDVTLHPIETSTEYNVYLSDTAANAPLIYLSSIALLSVTEDHVSKLEKLQRGVTDSEGDKQARALIELLEYVIAMDPWTQSKYKALKDTTGVTSSDSAIALVEAIQARAEERGVKIEPSTQRAMQEYLGFYRQRTAASRTMVDEAGRIADLHVTPVLAMNAGAAHTDGICRMLAQAKRPFAVLTPNALSSRDKRGDLDWNSVERKYHGKSVYSAGFLAAALERAFAADHKKPPPVTAEQWFQAKADLYLFIDRIVSGILGPPSPPNGGVPPFGFADDEFRGDRVYIAPNRIELLTDQDAVLFPVILNPADDTRRREIWVKATFGQGVSRQERRNVEEMLRDALERVQSETRTGGGLGDVVGRVQTSLGKVAVVAGSREEAMRTPN